MANGLAMVEIEKWDGETAFKRTEPLTVARGRVQ